MKRALLAIICCVVLLLGCENSTGIADVPDFCSSAGTAVLTGSAGETDFRLKVSFPGRDSDEYFTLTVLSPSELEGFCFSTAGAEAYCMSGDVKIPISSAASAGIMKLAGAFRISAEDIASAEPAGEEPMCIVASGDDVTYRIYTNADGVPVRIHWEGEYNGDFEVTEFASAETIK